MTKKEIYNCRNKSQLHKFLKEEGFARIDIAYDLNIAKPTVDTYLENPLLFKVEHIVKIAELTETDEQFIINLIKTK